MAKLLPKPPSAGGTTTINFTTSQTWVSPVGVTNLISVVGRGQDGTPVGSGSYGPPVNQSAVVVNVIYGGSANLGTDTGQYLWQYLQSSAPNAAYTINSGGSGYITQTIVNQYPNNRYDPYSYTIAGGSFAFSNAIPGSASSTTTGAWQSSGLIHSSGTSVVSWQEYGAFAPGSSGTTGANTTGFGKTWNGGVNGVATSVAYSNVTITASTSYVLSIPTGGFITITY